MFDINNMQNLIQQAKQVQDRYRDQLDKMAVRASAGGDTVTVVLNGRKELTKIEFGDTLPSNPSLLADMILSAMGSAYAQVDNQLQAMGPGQINEMMNQVNIGDIMDMFKK
jgi:nucleoid-associated protein EbfC